MTTAALPFPVPHALSTACVEHFLGVEPDAVAGRVGGPRDVLYAFFETCADDIALFDELVGAHGFALRLSGDSAISFRLDTRNQYLTAIAAAQAMWKS